MIDDREASNTIVHMSLKSPVGQRRLNNAMSLISSEILRGRYNAERATEILKIAIDNSVWNQIKSLPYHNYIYRDYRNSGLGFLYAKEAVRRHFGHVADQRPARRFLRQIFGA